MNEYYRAVYWLPLVSGISFVLEDQLAAGQTDNDWAMVQPRSRTGIKTRGNYNLVLLLKIL